MQPAEVILARAGTETGEGEDCPRDPLATIGSMTVTIKGSHSHAPSDDSFPFFFFKFREFSTIIHLMP